MSVALHLDGGPWTCPDVAPTPPRPMRAADALVDALRRGPLTLAELADRSGYESSTVRETAALLVRGGLLRAEWVRQGRNGRTLRYAVRS